MTNSRNWRRAVLVLVLTVVVLGVALRLSSRSKPTSFATPAACVEAFREASLAGDAPAYLACLGEPLRAQTRQRYSDDAALAETLRQEMKGVTAWVEVGTAEERDGTALFRVEEVRVSGNRPVRLHLEHAEQGWLIVSIDRGDEKPAGVRPGTRVGEEGDPARQTNP